MVQHALMEVDGGSKLLWHAIVGREYQRNPVIVREGM